MRAPFGSLSRGAESGSAFGSGSGTSARSTRRRQSQAGQHRAFHLVTALLLVVSLFAPLTVDTLALPSDQDPVHQLLAQQDDIPPTFPAPNQVVVAGDFQTQVGCSENWDRTCTQTELDEDSGIWSGFFAVPPGNWLFRVVAIADIPRSFGQGGDPDGGEISLNVPEGSVGAYFEYNTHTGQITGTAIQQYVVLNTDTGNFELAPTGDGRYEIYFDSPGGTFSYQVQINDEPVAEQDFINLAPGRVHIVVDSQGNIVVNEPVQTASLTVSKTDEVGNPLPGACFQVISGANQLANQGCDVDDGNDGSTSMDFPNGITPGNYRLVESRTPEDQPVAEEQQIQLGPGENFVQAVAVGEPVDEPPIDEPPIDEPPIDEPVEPTEPPIDEPIEPTGVSVAFFPTDPDGNLVPGACFVLDDGPEICDETGDGVVIFENVQPGPHTLIQTQAPEGYFGIGDIQINVGETDEQYRVPQEPAPVDEPTEPVEEPTPTPEATEPTPGVLSIRTVDEAGNLLPGACYTVTQVDGTYGPFCDADFDGVNDGQLNIPGVTPGEQILRQVEPPQGYEDLAPEQTVQLGDGETAQVDFVNRELEVDDTVPIEPTDPPPTEPEEPVGEGDLVILRADEEGNPVGGSCFAVISNGETIAGPVCDEDGDLPDDGRTGIFDIPEGTYTLRETRVPEGYEQAPDQQIEIVANQVTQTPVTSAALTAPTPTPEPEPETGSVLISKVDEDGNPLGGACFALTAPAGAIQSTQLQPVCDNQEGDAAEETGQILIEDVPPGEYVLTETESPEGYDPADDRSVQVEAGDVTEVTVENAATPPPLGTITITTVDGAGSLLTGACYVVINTAGQPFGPFCDATFDGVDDGVLTIPQVSPGTWVVEQSDPPAGFAPPESQTIEVEADEDTAVTFVNEEPETGAIQFVREDDDGQPLPGSCIQIDGPEGTETICDGGEGDVSDVLGEIQIEDLLPGQYIISEVQAPEGFEPADPESVEVEEGETTQLFAQTSEMPPSPGSLRITVVDPDGTPVPDACFVLEGEDDDIGPVCDNEAGDGEPAEGVILVSDIDPGSYTLQQTDVAEGFEPADDRTVEIVSDEETAVTVENEPIAPQTGTLLIQVRDEVDQPLGGACFDVTNADGTARYCDENNDGEVPVGEVPLGEQLIEQVEAPEGYEAAPSQSVTLTEDSPDATVQFQNEPLPPATGTIQVIATDEETGEQVGGACWTLFGPDTYGPLCDDGTAGGEAGDGIVTFEDVLTGDYTLTQEVSPAGYEAADDVPVSVVDGENPPVTVPHTPLPPEPGIIEITTRAPDGTPLPDACYALNGGEPVCDQDGSGTVRITEVQPGTYTLSQTQAFDDYQPADDQDITVESGQVLEVEVINQPPPTGAVVVIKQDQDGNPLGGSCFSLSGQEAEVCDNAEGDADPEVGRIGFENVPPGTYEVTETTPPPGYVAAGPQQVGVEADATAEVVFVNEPAPPETGTVEVVLEDPQGDPVPGGCVTLSSDAQGVVLGPFCDGGEGDAGDTDGLILLEDIPTGVYSVIAVDEEVDAEFRTAATRSVTVEAGQIIRVIIIIIIVQPTEGDLLVIKLDNETGQRIGGACFELSNANESFAICDQDAIDGDGTAGRIRFNDVPAGDYTLTETQSPAGYEASGSESVTIRGGRTTQIIIRNVPLPEPTGGLVVRKFDEGGNPLGGACFALRAGGNVVAGPVCDDDGDGRIDFADIQTGTYTLRETRRPSADYARVADRQVQIVAGTTIEIEVENRLRRGRVVIYKVDAADGAPLAGACFELRGPVNYDPRCDGDDGRNDGRIVFAGIVPGDYTAVEVSAPVGYEPGPDQSVTVRPGRSHTLTFENTLLPPPPQVGNLRVFKVDEADNRLPGACFSLRQNGVTIAGPRCDSDDGVSDGVITFTGVGVGTYQLHETRVPSAAYQRSADVEVTIQHNVTQEVTVRNVLKPGRVLVRKTDGQGNPLQGACFDLIDDGQGARCSNANGEILFSDLRPGTYRLTETQTPSGYLGVPDRDGIVVNAGQTTIIYVTNRKAPPPPNTGTIQVFKYYCPAGDGEERTQIIDSSDPGPNRLAKTGGCQLGNAEFTLLAAGREGGPGAFSTGDDGFYRVTLPAGEYVLTETAPQLPGGDRTENVRIFVNQMTTVIVLNFVRPPEPDPVNINVTKYTCPAGYEGTIYADFVDNCVSPDALTNNVTYRIAGPVSSRAITGDGGQTGRTAFTRVPAGNYVLTEEKPIDISTVYAFCGLDPNAPTLKQVGTSANVSIGFGLQPGQTIHCTYFNVPEDLTPTTGTILIHKFLCEVTEPPTGYDWYNECGFFTQGAQFSLSLYSGETQQYTPRATGTTNEDGLLRFSRLQPGQYQLQEIGAEWCHAESNSVDAKGDVIVRAGHVAEVWIFNCVAPKDPPNTGTGATAGGLLAPGGIQGGDEAVVTLSLVWPLVGAAAFGLLRRRQWVA